MNYYLADFKTIVFQPHFLHCMYGRICILLFGGFQSQIGFKSQNDTLIKFFSNNLQN